MFTGFGNEDIRVVTGFGNDETRALSDFSSGAPGRDMEPPGGVEAAGVIIAWSRSVRAAAPCHPKVGVGAQDGTGFGSIVSPKLALINWPLTL